MTIISLSNMIKSSACVAFLAGVVGAGVEGLKMETQQVSLKQELQKFGKEFHVWERELNDGDSIFRVNSFKHPTGSIEGIHIGVKDDIITSKDAASNILWKLRETLNSSLNEKTDKLSFSHFRAEHETLGDARVNVKNFLATKDIASRWSKLKTAITELETPIKESIALQKKRQEDLRVTLMKEYTKKQNENTKPWYKFW